MLSRPRPRTRKLTIIAQDPSIKHGNRVLITEVEVPAEELTPGPRGYRVHVVDYDTSTGTLYIPKEYDPLKDGYYPDPFKERAARANNEELIADPQFHAQNVYAIIMRTLARFEFALGRRVSWGFSGHQIHVAPHAFADANAFYSERDQALMFGYFTGQSGDKKELVFSCLSHDIIVHETTHALVDGLRERYTDPSSPEQAGFHEGFADVVALLSVFSLPDVVEFLLKQSYPEGGSDKASLIDPKALTQEALRQSVLLGLAEQMGQGLGGVRGDRAGALRRSVELAPLADGDDPDKYATQEEFQEPHRRGEILVAAMMRSFLDVWHQRIERMKEDRGGSPLDLKSVVEEGASAASHLLTMAIRALDYAPPTDLQFCDYLSALLTADREVVPDDSRYGYRALLLKNFAAYGLKPPTRGTDPDGSWEMVDTSELTHDRTHFESMLRDPDEVFRFIWENRKELGLHLGAFTKVQSVRPCLRIGPDGFTVRETVAEYIQMLTLRAEELQMLETPVGIPDGMQLDQEVTLYGGGALIFDEYGRLKYHARNPILSQRQTPRLKYLWEYGYFTRQAFTENTFARLHTQRATNRSRNATEEF